MDTAKEGTTRARLLLPAFQNLGIIDVDFRSSDPDFFPSQLKTVNLTCFRVGRQRDSHFGLKTRRILLR